MRKSWQKPKLVILVRGESAENVLYDCKTGGEPTEVNATYNELDCVQNLVNCENCMALGGT
jgi:hypothetical protein